MDSFLFKCDWICAKVSIHATLGVSLGDAMIRHTKRHGKKVMLFFNIDNCSSFSLVESLHEARDEEYGVAIARTNEL